MTMAGPRADSVDHISLEAELDNRSPEELDTATQAINESNTASIYTYGMGGSGKSSLIRELLGPAAKKKPNVHSGAKSVTLKKETYVIPVGNVQVHVVDTPGMFVLGEEKRDGEIVKSTAGIWEDCDLGGILLICIPMHNRIDRSTSDLIGELNDMLGDTIWPYAIIALTKADDYPEKEWLSEKQRISNRQQLTQKFNESLVAAKEELQKVFTSSRVKMSKEEFFKIPILPTSQFACGTTAHSKMEMVGYESWFDVLLLECCKKEYGIGILTIHQDRLSHLSSEILEKAGYPANLAEKVLPFFRKHMERWNNLGYLFLIVEWKLYFYFYSRKVAKYSRFQLAKKEDDKSIN